MSKQSRGKKRGGAAMPSDVSEDTSPTESAMLELDSPKNASGGNPDKEGGALVIPAIAKVGEKMINETGVALKRGLTINPGGGKRRAEPGTAKRRMEAMEEKLRKAEKDSNIPEDHSQVKHPLAKDVLLLVVPGLDPAVVIPLSTDIEQETTETTIAPASQLATAVSSKDPVAKKRRQGKQLPINPPNQIS